MLTQPIVIDSGVVASFDSYSYGATLTIAGTVTDLGTIDTLDSSGSNYGV